MSKRIHVTIAGVLGTALVFGAVAVCVRLGVWQLHRLREREAHNAVVERQMVAPPVPLKHVGVDTTVYRRVTVTGVYDDEHAIVLGNRTREGLPGVDLLSPLRLADGGVVLVERGWLPSADAETVDITPYARTDTVAVEGIVLPFPRRHLGAVVREPKGRPARAFARLWFQLDGAELSRRFPYPIAPFFVRETTGEAPPPGARPTHGLNGAPRLPHLHVIPVAELGRGPHLNYAIQWFSFALIFLVGWGAVLWRSSRKAGPGRV